MARYEVFGVTVSALAGVLIVCVFFAFLTVRCTDSSNVAHREQSRSQVARARACHVVHANPRDIAICLRLGK